MPVRTFTAVIVALGLLLPVGGSCADVDGCAQVAADGCCCRSAAAGRSDCSDPTTGEVGSGCDCPSVAEREIATVTPRPGMADDPSSRSTTRRGTFASAVDPDDEAVAPGAHPSETPPHDEILIETCVLRL